MIKIDKNVPMPSAGKYPFGDMDVGDSFFVAGKTAAQMGGTMHFRKPKKFTTRTVTENGVKGIRIWRVE